MSAISWTRAFVSRALQFLERSWESLARTHGCLEMWTLKGSGVDEAIPAGLRCVKLYQDNIDNGEVGLAFLCWKK